jgi:hypothetical protein
MTCVDHGMFRMRSFTTVKLSTLITVPNSNSKVNTQLKTELKHKILKQRLLEEFFNKKRQSLPLDTPHGQMAVEIQYHPTAAYICNQHTDQF